MSQELSPEQTPIWDVYGIAQQGANLQQQSLAAVYDDLRAKLNGETSDGQTVAKSLDEEHTERLKNFSVISSLYAALPHSSEEPVKTYMNYRSGSWAHTEDDEYILAKDIFSVRRLQASTLWQATSSVGERAFNNNSRPWYIIGETAANNRKQRSELLLLSGTGTLAPRIKTVTIRQKLTPLLRDAMAGILQTAPSESDMRKMYDPKTRSYKVTQYSEGSFSYNTYDDVFFMNRPGGRALTRLIKERNVDTGSGATFEVGPSNHEMAAFGVFEHLGRLATLFDISDKYQSILEEQGKVDQAIAASEPTSSAAEPTNDELQL